MGKNVIRLYEHFRPKHYILELHPDRENETFSGMVIINGQRVGRPSQRLTLHQNGLTVIKATVTYHDKKGDKELEIIRINNHDNFEEVRLHSQESLYPGNYTIRLHFEGKITRQMNGMYPCLFEYQGKPKQLIATQFESHHAREVFPCIDEPEAKATFDLILHTPVGETVLANTPIKSQETNGNLLKTTFETTPHMSTYLLAFVYGEMGFKEAKTKDGTIVRTYATPDNVQYTEFALDVAVKCLEFFNEYFAIPYPLPKCDFIALPEFASGAMENWGCITFREQSLLYDEANTSLAMKQYIAMVIPHELAHQWFGNLVTMRWWTDLWLNEGFASWISYLAADHLFPEWDFWTQFIIDEQQAAFKLDALENTHPVEVHINHPDEIRTIFDAISYEKGSSVIHMLHQFLGATLFRDGLRFYLDKHKYGNTDTVDLWDALEHISGKPVRQFMTAWTSQAGYPIVNATVEDGQLSVTQQRFYLNPKINNDTDVTWPIPLLSETESIADILWDREASYKISENDKIKLNSNQSAFYRTTYNATHLHHLSELVRRGQLAPLDRVSILSDSFEASKAGYDKTIQALHLLESYRNEDNASVWDIIAANLGSLRTVMDDEELREIMKPYIATLVEPQFKRLGWEEKLEDSHFDKMLRPTILGLASFAEIPAVVDEALNKFNQMTQPEDIHPDLRHVVYGTAVRLGGDAEFEKLLKIHNITPNAEERVTIAANLTGFKQPHLIKRALELITSDTVRLQDVSYWIAYSFSNRHGKRLTWEWTKTHWKWLEENLGTDLSFFRMPIYAARCFSDINFLQEYKDFFTPRLTPSFERTFKQGVEIIEWQAAWKERDFAEVRAFFIHYAEQSKH